MYRFSILLAIITLFTMQTAVAKPVPSSTAKHVAVSFIDANCPRANAEPIALCDSWQSSTGDTLMFVFNIGSQGFVIVSGNDDLTPIIGYSFNGVYQRDALPTNFEGWMESTVTDMEAFLASSTHTDAARQAQKEWKAEWQALKSGDSGYYSAKDGKNVAQLLSTQWAQGSGYNNYCPEWSGADNGRCVTGCVATAMAQIIRYHQYPARGFYHEQYIHPSYGVLRADFDSTTYNYNLMPNQVNYYSPANQQNEVSKLCYHCGIAVHMTYEYPQHTTGSGAHSEDVPEALMFFGYTNSYHLSKNGNDGIWDSLLQNDLYQSRPVYYSGKNSDGGHAFVCDGYKSSNGKYHFNFGWGGYTDGYYALNYVNGFATGQGAVFNIVPSGIASLHDTIYIDAAAHGDGSSWSQATPNILDALKLRGLYKSGQLWVRSGTYYGDTNANYAFKMPSGISIYGGFAGTEQSIDQRSSGTAPTIFSGKNKNMVVYASNLSAATLLNGITIRDGNSTLNGMGITMGSNMTIEYCTIENCRSSVRENAAVNVNGGRMFSCTVHNNSSNGVDIGGSSKICSSLIAHNDGYYGVDGYSGELINCNVVSNRGAGIVNRGTIVRNCIVWNNDSSLTDATTDHITFSAIEGLDLTGDTSSNITLLDENRPMEGYGPFFIDPDMTRGVSATLGDWRLSSLSPLVDAGDTLRRGIYSYDLDGTNRFRGGRIDIGCYEHDPYVGIEQVTDSREVTIYPNPASATLNIVTVAGMATLYDAMGRCVMTKELQEGLTVLDISHLPIGLYMLRTAQGATAKIIKR